MKQLHGFAPWPVQLGAEFVHGGENNCVVEIFEKLKWPIKTLEWPDRYYFESDGTDNETAETAENPLRALHGLVDANTAEQHPDIEETHRLLAELPDTPWVLAGDEDKTETEKDSDQVVIDALEDRATAEVDCTALEWLTNRVKANQKIINLAESVYANDFGCSLSTMGMRETSIEQNCWRHGEEYILLSDGRTLGDFVEALGKGVDVRVNHVVERVVWEESDAGSDGKPGGVRVTVRDASSDASDAKNQVTSIRASAVIVATPISAQKIKHWSPHMNTSITFEPNLSHEKVTAIEKIQMSDAVKILLSFDEKFWPKDVWNIVCCDSYFPELWMLEYGTEETNKTIENVFKNSKPIGKHVVTIFACGEKAKEIAKASAESPSKKQEIIEKALDQLDGMFGGESSTTGETKPSRSRFVDSLIYPWSEVSSVGGSYTHPSVFAAGARLELQKGEYNDTLFFAGEAVNVECNPCMQGAISTGLNAARLAATNQSMLTNKPLPTNWGTEENFVESFRTR